jgi:hypothetical protein
MEQENSPTQGAKNVAAYVLTGLMLANVLIFFFPHLDSIKAEIAGLFNFVLYILNIIVKKVWGIDIGG